MNEKELGVIVDESFRNIEFDIKNEVSYPHVRIDKEATKGNLRYIMELEGTKRYNSGVRQLQQIREIRKNPGGIEYKKDDEKKFIHHNVYVLVIPEITNVMIDIPKLFQIRLLDIEGLKKIKSYNIQKPTIHILENNDYEEFINNTVSRMKEYTVNGKEKPKKIFCDIMQNGNQDKNIRLTLSRNEINIIGYHGVNETFYFKGKRMKTHPDWEALVNRVNENNDFKTQLVNFERNSIRFHDPAYYRLSEEEENKIWNIEKKIQKMLYWIFPDKSNSKFISKIYEVPNPFEIANGSDEHYFQYY